MQNDTLQNGALQEDMSRNGASQNAASQVVAYIALGSNLGDRSANVSQALEMLGGADGVSVLAVSDTIETKPLSNPVQDNYINAVAKIATSLPAERLHRAMLSIEDSLGRLRTGKWLPRPMDLDLLLYGDQVIETDDLTVPHRQMHLRSFVLIPMSQIAPDVVHPVLGRSISDLAGRLGGGDFALDNGTCQLISIAGPIGAGKTTIGRALSEIFGCRFVREAYDTNPYLPQVCAGRKDLAMKSQLYFLDSREEQLSRDVLPPGRLVISDYIFEKDGIFARRTLDQAQWAEYRQHYDRTAQEIAAPTVVIYLYGNCRLCLDRIRSRNRPYEQRIELAELQSLADDYEQFFQGWRSSPVIKLDIERFDCRHGTALRRLADELLYYTSVLQTQEPVPGGGG